MNLLEQLPPSTTLTAGQEKALLANGLHQDLVMTAIREALLYTRKCSYGKIPDDALLSLCYETMLMSAKIFKPGRLRFFAYCKARLRGAVKRYWRSLETVRNAETVSLDVESPYKPGFRRGSSKRLGPIEVRTKPFVLERPTPIYEDEDESPPTMSDIMGGVVEPEFEKMQLNDSWELISTAMRRYCTDQEKTVLYLAFKCQLSFEEIGDLLDISRQFASVTAKKAINKLRRALTGKATI